MGINSVVQFNENHKWCGCLGVITEIKNCGDDIRYMVGVPIPQGESTATAYIFVMDSDKSLEYIGEAVLVMDLSDD